MTPDADNHADDLADGGVLPPGTSVVYRRPGAAADEARSATVLRVLEDGRYLIQLDPRDPTRDDYLDAVLAGVDPVTRAWLLAHRDQGDAALAAEQDAGIDDQTPLAVDAETLTPVDDDE